MNEAIMALVFTNVCVCVCIGQTRNRYSNIWEIISMIGVMKKNKVCKCLYKALSLSLSIAYSQTWVLCCGPDCYKYQWTKTIPHCQAKNWISRPTSFCNVLLGVDPRLQITDPWKKRDFCRKVDTFSVLSIWIRALGSMSDKQVKMG